ncbi:hypothetical protein AMST5_00079 [freshwater sediment metagenome]|uniref:Uncharacterized protein n=1 Tax=freshwater sediment metagenome TaxID=556182 RepID=A0AA48RBI6_9ZZZZ
MSFVVDGTQWRFDDLSPHEIGASIERLLDRVSTALDRNEIVWIGDDLQTRSVLYNLDLWSLFSPEAPISLSAELAQELAAWLGRAPRYADEVEWPEGLDDILIRVDDDETESADIAWAHHHVRAGRPVACLGVTKPGPRKTESSHGNAIVHWVVDEATHRAFWRSAIEVEGDNEDTVQRIAPHAFPDLYFHDGVWDGLKHLAGGYYALSSEIRRYFAVLDDHGKWAFTCPPPALSPGEAADPSVTSSPPNQIIERRFSGLGLTMAPENPDVYADRRCRSARQIKIGEKTFYCEWHGKLEPHRNRVHVHSPAPESKEKVIIGIIHEHLPLPGD